MKEQQSATAQTPSEWGGEQAAEGSEVRAQKRIITQSERDEVKELLRQQAEVKDSGAECSEVGQ